MGGGRGDEGGLGGAYVEKRQKRGNHKNTH